MIKIETHCHTGASECADAPISVLAQSLVDGGYKGAIITNHFHPRYFKSLKGETDKEKIDSFFAVYDETKEIFTSYGLKTFLGAEILVKNGLCHSEYVLYGFKRELFYENELLFNLTQEELYRLCEKNGVFMSKVHPFRTGETNGDPKYMHGAESYNGHYHHENHNDLAKKFCVDNGLIELSGTDLHHEGQPITGGIYIPEDIEDEFALTEFIKKGNLQLVCDEELRLKKVKEFKAGLCK